MVVGSMYSSSLGSGLRLNVSSWTGGLCDAVLFAFFGLAGWAFDQYFCAEFF